MRKLLFILLIAIGFGAFSQHINQKQTKDQTTTRLSVINFHCQDIDGKTWDLFELLDAGKYVLLDFDYHD